MGAYVDDTGYEAGDPKRGILERERLNRTHPARDVRVIDLAVTCGCGHVATVTVNGTHYCLGCVGRWDQ